MLEVEIPFKSYHEGENKAICLKGKNDHYARRKCFGESKVLADNEEALETREHPRASCLFSIEGLDLLIVDSNSS